MSALLIFQLLILIFAIMIHEVSHGSVANALGDPTAKELGRLSFNPLKHLDIWGSFIVPFGLYLVSGGSFVFGWAKPVPFNPLNLKKPKRDIGLVALAGPVSNLTVAVIFGILLRLGGSTGVLSPSLITLFSLIILINIVLAVFNLVPIPPLDGSKILFSLAPRSWAPIIIFLEAYGLIILLFFIFFAFHLIWPMVGFLFRLIAGPVPLTF